jgi:hypothetical protein
MASIPIPIIDQTIELALTIIRHYDLHTDFGSIVSEVQSINVHITEAQIQDYLQRRNGGPLHG